MCLTNYRFERFPVNVAACSAYASYASWNRRVLQNHRLQETAIKMRTKKTIMISMTTINDSGGKEIGRDNTEEEIRRKGREEEEEVRERTPKRSSL